MTFERKIKNKLASSTICLLMLFVNCLAAVPLHFCSSRGELCFTKLTPKSEIVKSCCCCSKTAKPADSITNRCCEEIPQELEADSLYEDFSVCVPAVVTTSKIEFNFSDKTLHRPLFSPDKIVVWASPPIYLLKQSFLT